jgi:uncharacterized damage-inducible protein DinB
MKPLLIQLAHYNQWANEITINWLRTITEEQYQKQVISSFDSIEKTSIHIAGAEKIWVERWTGVTEPFLSNVFTGSLDELIVIWTKSTQDIIKFIEGISEDQLLEVFTFTRLNGDVVTQSYLDTIHHLIHHGCYHRGQIVTMLRQVGFTQIDSTDYITFIRNKNAQ